MTRHLSVVGSIVGSIIMCSCASASQDAWEVIGAHQANGSYEIGGTLPELLAKADELGITVVEGIIERVDPGVGMTWSFDNEDTGDSDQRQILPFDDAAQARSAHVTMSTDRVLVGSSEGTTVRFGLTIDDERDAATLNDGLVGTQYVVVLTESLVFDYEPGVYGVLVDGGLLCVWDDDRDFDCPALEEPMRLALAVAEVSEVSEATLTAG